MRKLCQKLLQSKITVCANTKNEQKFYLFKFSNFCIINLMNWLHFYSWWMIFFKVLSFQYAHWCKWFSRKFLKMFRTFFSKNKAVRALLISSDYSLKTSRTLFNPLTPGGNMLKVFLSMYDLLKRSHILKQTFNKDF